MNTIEKALMHALFFHLHHNIDKAIDFEGIEALNNQASKIFPDALVVGPGDDAAAFKFPGTEGTFVAKMESHCSPCVPDLMMLLRPEPVELCAMSWPWAPDQFFS